MPYAPGPVIAWSLKAINTAAFFWPETKDDPSIDYNIPEVFTPEQKADITAVDGKWMNELRSASVPIDLYFRWYGTERHGAADAVLAEAAAYTIHNRQDPTPARLRELACNVGDLTPARVRAFGPRWQGWR